MASKYKPGKVFEKHFHTFSTKLGTRKAMYV